MTQLNTPYPATAYLTRFLRQQGYQVEQRDLAIELLLDLLSRNGLEQVYHEIEERFSEYSDDQLPDEIYHFFSQFSYIQQAIEPCIRFLQGKDPSLALRICSRHFLPEGPAFEALYQLEEQLGEEILKQAFGDLGLQDMAKYLATLFINDLCAIIQSGIDPLFEVSRYGEQLAISAPLFDPIYQQLQQPETLVQKMLKRRLLNYLDEIEPDVLGLSVPFPGNLISALQIGRYCKQHSPKTKIILGGGYPNTELRDLKDHRIFEFVDFITLDDGERPFLNLLEHLENKHPECELCRTYQLKKGAVFFHPHSPDQTDFPHQTTGYPCYDGLPLERYLSLCEMLNPMHRIWSDGRWNKLTIIVDPVIRTIV